MNRSSACGFRRLEVAIERGEFFLFCAARVELADAADENHLERRHQRWCLRAVQNFEDRGRTEIEIGKTEIAKIGWYKSLEHGGSASVEEKDFVAGQHITSAKLARARGGSLNLSGKAGNRAESRTPARTGQSPHSA